MILREPCRVPLERSSAACQAICIAVYCGSVGVDSTSIWKSSSCFLPLPLRASPLLGRFFCGLRVRVWLLQQLPAVSAFMLKRICRLRRSTSKTLASISSPSFTTSPGGFHIAASEFADVHETGAFSAKIDESAVRFNADHFAFYDQIRYDLFPFISKRFDHG